MPVCICYCCYRLSSATITCRQYNCQDVRPAKRLACFVTFACNCSAQVLQWTRDWGVAQQLAWRVASAYVEECSKGNDAMEGAREWLQALASSRVPCALVSSMSRYATYPSFNTWVVLCTPYWLPVQSKLSLHACMNLQSLRLLHAFTSFTYAAI